MYDELYEAWKKEKESGEVQPLARDFYPKMVAYLKNLKEESRMLDEKTLRGRLLQRERENVRRLAEELMRIRFAKITRMVSTSEVIPEASLSEEEAALSEGISSSVESYLSVLNGILQGRQSNSEEKKKPKTILVRILKEIPSIIGADMKTYGPFKPEDVVALPPENGRILVKQGVAEEIEAE